MATTAVAIGAPIVLGAAALLQAYIAPVAFDGLGFWRTMQPLSDFPAYSCRRVEHPLLEGCEDMWLDQTGRRLLAACADPETRTAYQPTVDRRNASARTGRDRFVALTIDHPGPKRDYQPVRLTPSGYSGAAGDGALDLHGFDVEPGPAADSLRIFAVNHRPPVGAEGELLDAQALGCNSTVEVFDHVRGSNALTWVRTIFHPTVVKTPNRVALVGDGSGTFVSTNDHGHKTDRMRAIEPIVGRGSLAYCSGAGACRIATPENLIVPNGITHSAHDGLFYVPSSSAGTVQVYQLEKSALKLLHTIRVGMPIDNLTVDRRGVIWAAAFPKALQLLAGFDNPRQARSPAAVWRIERRGDSLEYDVQKVLEDRDAEVLPATTTVVHDAETGRLFLGGVWSPYLAVCEAR